MADRKPKVTFKGPARVLPSGPDVFDDTSGETAPAAVWKLRRERAARAALERARGAEQGPPLGIDLSPGSRLPGAQDLSPDGDPSSFPGPERFLLDASLNGGEASPALAAVLGRAGGPGGMMMQAGDTGQVPEITPGLMERFLTWLRSSGAASEPAGRDVAEGMNEALPRPLSGRDAVERRRRDLARMDAALKDT